MAEIVIVVAGVLIALGIDEWRENIQENELEERYLIQVVSELQTTEEQQANSILENASYRTAADNMRAAFEGDAYPEKIRIREWLSEMRLLGLTAPLTATLDSMVSTGDLRLVQDPIIRSRISEYLSYAQDWYVGITQRTERHRELHFQIMNLSQMYGISPSHFQGPFRASTKGDATRDVAALMADPRAYVYVASFAENRAIFVIYRENLIDEAKRLRASLEVYLSTI